MRYLAPEDWIPYHRQVLCDLTEFSQNVKEVRPHSAGPEFTALMSCFFMQNVSAARSLLALYESSGVEWFPVTVGGAIARTMFEVDVTAHYITQEPQERARQYILFEYVLDKRAMDACNKYRRSGDPSWREAMDIEWRTKWENQEQDVNNKFAEVESSFTSAGKSNRLFRNWSGKSIRQLAVEVSHEEAYDTFYSDLSSFTHGDVRLAKQFLGPLSGGPVFTQRSKPHDVGEVLHDAASFLTCYLKLFGSQFGVWNDADVDAFWDADPLQARDRDC